MAISYLWRPAFLKSSQENELNDLVDPLIVEIIVDMIRSTEGTTMEELYTEILATREEVNEVLSGLYDSELIYTDYRQEPARIRWGWARSIRT